jgi:hypothetical protein
MPCCPVQPLASLECLGIFDSEGFPERKSARLVRPRALKLSAGCGYQLSIYSHSSFRRQPTRTSLQKSILSTLHFSNNSEPAILKPKQNHEMPLASILL